MTLDAHTLFSDNQKITVTASSENVVATGGNIGAGQPLFVVIYATENFAGATSLTIVLEHAEKAAGTFTTLVSGPALTLAQLNAGAVIDLGCLPAKSQRFLRLRYVVGGTATTGKLTAGLTINRVTE